MSKNKTNFNPKIVLTTKEQNLITIATDGLSNLGKNNVETIEKDSTPILVEENQNKKNKIIVEDKESKFNMGGSSVEKIDDEESDEESNEEILVAGEETKVSYKTFHLVHNLRYQLCKKRFTPPKIPKSDFANIVVKIICFASKIE